MFDQWITPKGRLSSKQPQDIKNQWYIQKFQEVHGNLYDYSRVQYTTNKSKVEIICKIHGVFEQSPNHHQKGLGCSQCASCKKTLETCIRDFIEVHGHKYLYDLVDYVNSRTKVKIVCPEHGEFEQTPQIHVRGSGCPYCQTVADTVYLMYCNNTGLTKIGITNNVKRRLSQIGGELTLLAQYNISSPRRAEKQLQIQYQDFREFNQQVYNGNTEFFRLSTEQIHDIMLYLSSL